METNESDLLKNLSQRSTGDPEEITGRIRDWLLRCGEHKNCSTKATKRTAHPDGFCLFDITALKVVDALGHEPYIALSYPWSHIDQFEIKRDGPYTLEDLPKVLQDVVGLVKSLGFGVNHIWMDRLCINQDNQGQKTANINAMGDIYGAAFATIILAVPSRRYLEQGIPGLSAPRPPNQRIETIGNIKLAILGNGDCYISMEHSSLEIPRRPVIKSLHSLRAWAIPFRMCRNGLLWINHRA